MKLNHLDNCFFPITQAQAKILSKNGTLPRVGYMVSAKLDVDAVALLDRGVPCRLQPKDALSANIQHTRQNNQMILCIHYYFDPSA